MTITMPPNGEPISGLCFDDLHSECDWPVEAAFILYCSCYCHERPAPMPVKKEDIPPAEAQEIEADTDGGYLPVPLAGYDGATKDVRVLPATRWRASAMRALNTGDIDGFMELVLHEDDYDIYVDLDPDAEGIGRFAQKASEASGEALGKSSGPRPSSRSTRKR